MSIIKFRGLFVESFHSSLKIWELDTDFFNASLSMAFEICRRSPAIFLNPMRMVCTLDSTTEEE
jgi:hypothetical protein